MNVIGRLIGIFEILASPLVAFACIRICPLEGEGYAGALKSVLREGWALVRTGDLFAD